jgi:hypothetical protein
MRRSMHARGGIEPDAINTAVDFDNRGSTAVAWRSNRSAWLLAAILSAIAARPLQEALTRFPRGPLADDAYFYVKVARAMCPSYTSKCLIPLNMPEW